MISILLIYLALIIISCCQAQQQQDPSKFNGGSILAMSGHNSVAIAIDSRFGLGFQTISTGEQLDSGNNNNDGSEDSGSIIYGEGNPRIIQLPNSNTLLAWSGLYGDGISFTEELNILLTRKVRKAACMGFSANRRRKKMISPRAITMLMSALLYRRRNSPYYVEPVVVGLEDVCVPIIEEKEEESNVENDNNVISSNEIHQAISSSGTTSPLELISTSQKEKQIIHRKQSYKTIQKPYLCGTDMLGAQSTSTSFVCSGVASRSLHGTAEALWRPNLDGEELVEVCGRAFVSALERDILSGYGAVVYLIQGGYGDDGMGVQIIEYVLACRND